MGWQCVYCKRRFPSYTALPAHDATCDAKEIVTRQWEETIARAKLRELRQDRARKRGW